MTPYNIELLIHFHCSNARFPRDEAPIFDETIQEMFKLGLLEPAPLPQVCKITDKGRAHVHFICMMPLPMLGWSTSVLPQTFYQTLP